MPSPGIRRAAAALQALLVCFVWSTSFIITKYLYGQGIGPVTLTGLRFALAALVLLPVWVRRRRTVHTGNPAGPKVAARLLIVLGLAGYAINPLGYNLGLTVLDASWVAVLLGVNNSLQVLIWSALLLRERPTRLQLGAIAVAMVAIVGFQMPDAGPYRWALAPTSAVIASGVGYALWIVGNRSLVSRMHPLDLACPSMLAGSVPVLLIGIATEGPPSLTAAQWLLVIVLAVVNTAAAFTVWTHTQRTLTAYESAAINNTMTVQTALLAFVFLKEPLTASQWITTVVIMSATLAIQLTGRTPSKASPRSTDAATCRCRKLGHRS